MCIIHIAAIAYQNAKRYNSKLTITVGNLGY